MSEKIKYLDTYNRMKSDIISGKYPYNTLLPTEMELCKIYGVGRSTLRRAIGMLSDENFVKAKQGFGTTVSYSTDNYTHSDTIFGSNSSDVFRPVCKLPGPYSYSSSPISIDKVPSSEAVAEKLMLDQGTDIFRGQRLLFVNGNAYAYLVNYINPTLAPDFDKDDVGEHITEYFVNRYGVKRTDVKGTLNIKNADFKISRFLGIELNTPCIILSRMGFFGNSVYDFSETYYNPSLVDMEVTFSRRDFLDDTYVLDD